MNYTTYPNCKPSFAEELIINILNSRNIEFDREVSFEGLINPATQQPLRYDFYIPHFNIIIEYDGIESHASNEVKARDNIKNNFAKKHRIKLIRISGINYISTFFDSKQWCNQVKGIAIHRRSNGCKKSNIPTQIILKPSQYTQSQIWDKIKNHRNNTLSR